MEGVVSWVDFKYECLTRFCFDYGRLGHESWVCDEKSKQENDYGPWIKAETKVMSSMYAKRETRLLNMRISRQSLGHWEITLTNRWCGIYKHNHLLLKEVCLGAKVKIRKTKGPCVGLTRLKRWLFVYVISFNS